MDDFELASQHEEFRRVLAMKYRRPVGPDATGKCLFCEQPLPEGVRWCNAECRADWEALQRAERMQPRCEES